MKPGDHVMIDRGAYMHHGIFVGDGYVVHWTGDAEKKLTGVETPVIVMERVKEFGPKDLILVVEYDESIEILGLEDTISRALHKVGTTDYNLAFNNCEHFAVWCKTGLHESTQVDAALDWLASLIVRMRATI